MNKKIRRKSYLEILNALFNKSVRDKSHLKLTTLLGVQDKIMFMRPQLQAFLRDRIV